MTDLLSETKAVLRSLLFSSPKSMNITELDSDYLKYEGHRIPFNRLGYPDLKKFLSSIPDILTISYFDEVVPITAGSRSEHIPKLVAESQRSNGWNRLNIRYGYQRPTPKIKLNYAPRKSQNDYVDQQRDDLTRKISQLEVEPLNGAPDFDSKIEKETNLLDQAEVAETKMTTERVADEKSVEQSEGIEEFVMTANENVTMRVSNEDECDNPVAEKTHGSVPSLNEDEPILSFGFPITSSKIPNASITELIPGRTYNVLVTEMSQPWRFWFSLCDKNAEELLEKQLMWCYNGEKRIMRTSEMVAGNACLVTYKGKFLRAEFMDSPINDKVKVCFVDYGTIDMVGIAECRHMKKYFASIPKRCFPGSLELMDPMVESSDKQLKMIQSFCKMVHDKPLVGFVTNVDQKNDVVRMILMDTSDVHKDVIVNQKLLASD